MGQDIAFFDFDGTITTRDTLLEFIKFSKGQFPFYLGFALNSPWLIAYRLKLISNQAAKEKILSWFFRNTPLANFQEDCHRFSTQVLPQLIRPKALQEIRKLQEKGFTVVIVSASPENWLSPWAASLDLSLLATQLETAPSASPKLTASHPTPSVLTGKILGLNCHGQEKVRRIRSTHDLTAYNDILAYGDTPGDRPMLALAEHSFYKPFR